MIHVSHPLGLVGMLVNMAGGLLLIWFPAKVTEYTKDGLWIPDGATISELPRNHEERERNKRRYWRRRLAFVIGLVLLIFGSMLIAVDLLTS